MVLGLMLMFLGSAQAAEPAAGAALYAAKCQACHGKLGKGDGPAARALPKAPKDMSDAAYWSGKTDEQVAQLVRAGRPGSAMRGFPMDDAKMAELVAYLRAFPTMKADEKPAPAPAK